MLCVCVGDVMDVVFSVCIVRRGAVGARVWGVCVLRRADVVCLCLVCIMWQFSVEEMCRVCGCYRGGIVVMDVFWRRLCISMI